MHFSWICKNFIFMFYHEFTTLLRMLIRNKKHHQSEGLLYYLQSYRLEDDSWSGEAATGYSGDQSKTRYCAAVLVHEAMVLTKLTVPWEEMTEEAYERKRLQDEMFIKKFWAKGWSTRCDAIVGCRRFVSQSLWNTFRTLGIVGTTRKKATHTISEVVENSSRRLWLKRSVCWKQSAAF